MSSGVLKVAVFRASEEAAATQAQLFARGVETILAPVTEIVALSPATPAGPFDFAIATSARAFAFGAQAALAGLPLFVVGEKTAQAAQLHGLAPAPAAQDVAELLTLLPAGRALYLAGRDRKPDLERALVGRIEIVETYAAMARGDWSADEAESVAGATAALHYSARGATLAAALALRSGIAPDFLRLIHVCMSRETAAALADAGAPRALWPQRPNESALIDVLESALAERL